jgi:hypothetical protein
MDHEGKFEDCSDNEIPLQIANFHFLENQVVSVLPKKILKLINDYLGKCLDSYPLLPLDGGLEKSSVFAIFLYWLVSRTSFKRIGNKSNYRYQVFVPSHHNKRAGLFC